MEDKRKVKQPRYVTNHTLNAKDEEKRRQIIVKLLRINNSYQDVLNEIFEVNEEIVVQDE